MTFLELDKPAQFLKGVGPRRAESLARMGILTARDLLYHLPRRYDDASTITPLASAEVGMEVTVVGEIGSKGVIPTRRGLRIFQVVIRDDTGALTCSWPGQPWLDRELRVGDRILVTGPVRSFHGRQIQPREHALLDRMGSGRHDHDPPTHSHPRGRTDHPQGRKSHPPGRQATAPDAAPGTIFVTYPASKEVPQWGLRRILAQNLEWLLRHAAKEDAIDTRERRGLGLPRLDAALAALHRPRSIDDVAPARRRLAYDELLLLQLLHARVRHHATRETPGIAMVRTNRLVRALHDSLPFELTGAQVRVLREIYADMASPTRMNRLLQGDVGSGKTLVALFAMLLAVEGGHQAALMVPTSVLAEQHAARVGELLRGLPCEAELLTGSVAPQRRRTALGRIASGDAQIVVGTHALIQEGVEFDSLGLAVIDEQQRFGVRQRLALGERDPAPDVLAMSATPIPRSLAMAIHGDLDISQIDDLPPGRRPVATWVRSPEERDQVLNEVVRRLEKGEQAFIVYPLIEESEKAELLAAKAEFERLRDGVLAGHEVALVHGRVAAEDRERIMRDFVAGKVRALVATTVIEVGVDVAGATVMVIENAERFGLSQLHQLRGRVGRGERGGLCVAISEAAGRSRRLRAFARTTDGFEIAAEDLRIRGQGDFFGADQHGHGQRLRIADLVTDSDLVGPARARARAVVEADPRLERPEHHLLRHLMERRYRDRAKLFGVG